MGLSNEERMNNVYSIISHLQDLKNEHKHEPGYAFGTEDTVRRLKKLIAKIWPTFLGHSSNGMYWIFGGESSARTLSSEGGVLCNAFTNLDKSCFFPEPSDEDRQYDFRYRKSHDKRTEEEDLRYFLEDFVLDKDLLDRNEKFVWSVFQYCESYFYSANRYHDKVSRKLQPLTNIFANMYGLCYMEFSKRPAFFKAWMARNILSWIIDPYNTDVFSQWLRKHHVHHNMSLSGYDDKEIVEDFKRLRSKMGPVPLMERFKIIFKFIGASYYYEHQHKDLYKMAADAKMSPKDIDTLRQLCERSKKLHDEREKEEKERLNNREDYDNVLRDSFSMTPWEKPEEKKETSLVKKSEKKPAKKKVATKKKVVTLAPVKVPIAEFGEPVVSKKVARKGK